VGGHLDSHRKCLEGQSVFEFYIDSPLSSDIDQTCIIFAGLETSRDVEYSLDAGSVIWIEVKDTGIGVLISGCMSFELIAD